MDSRKVAVEAMTEIQFMVEKGFITAEEAAKKKSEVLDHMLNLSTGERPRSGSSLTSLKSGHITYNKKLHLIDIDHERLIIYDAEGSIIKKKVALRGNTVAYQILPQAGGKFPFTITVGKLKLQFSADSEEDRTSWIRSLPQGPK